MSSEDSDLELEDRIEKWLRLKGIYMVEPHSHEKTPKTPVNSKNPQEVPNFQLNSELFCRRSAAKK